MVGKGGTWRVWVFKPMNSIEMRLQGTPGKESALAWLAVESHTSFRIIYRGDGIEVAVSVQEASDYEETSTLNELG